MFYCLVLAMSLVVVPQLLVTGFSGEGIENVSCGTAPEGYFTTYIVGHKVKGAEFWVQHETMWTFMKCWTLPVITGTCCHSDCCSELSKAVSK